MRKGYWKLKLRQREQKKEQKEQRRAKKESRKAQGVNAEGARSLAPHRALNFKVPWGAHRSNFVPEFFARLCFVFAVCHKLDSCQTSND